MMRLRDYIKQIETDQLFENKKQYKQMFEPVFKLAVETNTLPDAEPRAFAAISKFTKLLKRQDRIIFMLRYFRVGMLIDLISEIGDETHPSSIAANRIYQKDLDIISSRKVERTTKEVKAEVNSVLSQSNIERLEHYMAYTIKDTDNYSTHVDDVVWGKGSFDNLLVNLAKAEGIWRKRQNQYMPPTPETYDGAEKVLDFGNGWAWWNLNVDQCGAEGSAMGHCGNAATPSKGDRVLSFRREMTPTSGRRSGQLSHRPSLTFILHADGFLGEMKGRANQKPDKKYHPYIIELLRQPFVEGIRSGGYEAQNNFSIYDLEDQDLIAELLEFNPDLESFWDRLAKVKKGLIPEKEISTELNQMVSEVGLPPVSIIKIGDKPIIVLQEWNDIEDFAREIDWTLLDDFVSFINLDDNESVLSPNSVSIVSEDYFEIFRYLTDQELNKLRKGVGLPTTERPNEFRASNELANSIGRSYYTDIFQEAATSEYNNAMLKSSIVNDPKYKEYITNVIEYGISRSFDYYQIEFVWDQTPDGSAFAVVDMSDLQYMMGHAMLFEEHQEKIDNGDEDVDEYLDLDDGTGLASFTHSHWENNKHKQWYSGGANWNVIDHYGINGFESEELESMYGDKRTVELHQKFTPLIKTIVDGDASYIDNPIVGNEANIAKRISSYLAMNENKHVDPIDVLIEEIKKRAGI